VYCSEKYWPKLPKYGTTGWIGWLGGITLISKFGELVEQDGWLWSISTVVAAALLKNNEKSNTAVGCVNRTRSYLNVITHGKSDIRRTKMKRLYHKWFTPRWQRTLIGVRSISVYATRTATTWLCEDACISMAATDADDKAHNAKTRCHERTKINQREFRDGLSSVRYLITKTTAT